ncbi:MAG: 3-oxoacyl-ACP reductase FabG [Pseudomonadales bacterium]
MFELNDQVAVVTGAARGIGRGIAETLKLAGATVVIADIDTDRGQATAAELGVGFIRTDVSSADDCRNSVDQVVERHGRLDVLCANTGIFPQARLETMSEEDWNRVIDINLKGTFLMVQAALRPMRQQRYGRVVITSSITGPVTGYPGWTHYGASKAGQLGFMRSAALEVARLGITINAVMPGNILTEGLEAEGESYLQQMRAAVPTHELGTPEDIGHAVCFLASKQARYITGQQLIIDGGQILPESPDAIE